VPVSSLAADALRPLQTIFNYRCNLAGVRLSRGGDVTPILVSVREFGGSGWRSFNSAGVN
jgi:hypothetical protein